MYTVSPKWPQINVIPERLLLVTLYIKNEIICRKHDLLKHFFMEDIFIVKLVIRKCILFKVVSFNSGANLMKAFGGINQNLSTNDK